MPYERLQDVANDYENLLKTKEENDVIIYAGYDTREIHAHSLVLRIRSQYFRTEFSSKKSLEKKNGKFIFKIPNISFDLFGIILRFIYCGRIDLDRLHESDILKLLIAVEEIKIHVLTSYIQEYLIKNKDTYIQQNTIEILEKIYQNSAFTNLQNICIKKICKDPGKLLNKFKRLNAPLLELLLKRDELSLDEVDIWDNLIERCFAKHSDFPRDPNKWDNDKIKMMERTIHNFIPLVRFCNISPENFSTKIFPFKEILSKDLINGMVQFHMAHNKQIINDKRPPRCYIDSIIINQDHVAIFANWIYRKDKFYGYIPYKFNLLYRASRDGNTTEAFHAKCDNKRATLVVIKMKNSNQIVGGYNPFSWDTTSGWRSTCDSFIFLFTDRNNLQSAKVCYSRGDAESIGCHLDKGPTFGWNLNVYKGTWYNDRTNSYPIINDLPQKFDADDYEVFEVIPK